MGQAKQKRVGREMVEAKLEQFDVARLASAIRRLSVAASSHLGADCYSQAVLAKAVMAAHGIDATLVVGYAAWRTAGGSGDVILHAPMPGMPPQPGGAPYHVWLEVSGRVLDLTTSQLVEKGRQLDLLDGGHTTVDWCPDYLFVHKRMVSPLKAVIQSYCGGVYYYEHVPTVEKMIVDLAKPLDPDDVDAALLLYANPDLAVYGPNNIENLRQGKRGERAVGPMKVIAGF